MLKNRSLRTKLLFAFLPVNLLLLVLVVFVSLDQFVLSVKMEFVRDMARLLRIGAESVHQQQLERDAALLYLEYPTRERLTTLERQLKVQEPITKRARALIEEVNWARYSAELDAKLKESLQNQDRVEKLRQQVRARSIEPKAVAAHFNSAQQASFKVISGMMDVGLFPRLLISLEAVNRQKEIAGRERVTMELAVLKGGKLAPADRDRVLALAGQQESAEAWMRSYGGNNEDLAKRLESNEYKQVIGLRRRALRGGDVGGTQWYAAATDRIDVLKALNDQITKEILESAISGSRQATLRFYLAAILGLVILLASGFMAVRIIREITSSASHLSGVMNEVAHGNLGAEVPANLSGEFRHIGDSIRNTITIWNDMLGRLRTAINQIKSGSAQIADSAAALSQGATEQASSVEEITAAVSELASQSKRTVEYCEKASAIASTSRGRADEGEKLMGDMVEAMRRTNQSSQNIAKIIKSIDEIAFQTNLLALNAAVEAARAGSHGKGFTVVAEEVKNLSVRSAQAARETADLIEESIQRANSGVDMAEKTAAALNEINRGVQQTAGLLDDISTASREQVTGISQIEESIHQIEQVTHQSAANAEENAATSEELSGQAVELAGQVAKFHLSEDNTSMGSAVQARTHPDYRAAQQRSFATTRSPADSELNRGGQQNAKSGQPEKKLRPEDVISLEDDDFGGF